MVLENGKTCRWHEARGIQITEIEKKVAEHGIMLQNFAEAKQELVDTFKETSGKSEKTLKDLCNEIKAMKITLQRSEARDVKIDQLNQKEIQDELDRQPIGWLNSALKKVFSNPVFWILFGWFIIKTFVFKEYPAFLKGFLGG